MTSKRFPQSVQFILCEDVRQLDGGKQDIVGWFIGDDINISEPVGKDPLALDKLCIFALFKGGAGTFTLDATFTPAGKKPLKKKVSDSIEMIDGAPCGVSLRFVPFRIENFGVYELSLQFDEDENHIFPYRFKVSNDYES
ncbi:MAG: hypothetical protein ABI644_07405 [Arenimonas sp.]